MNARAEQRLAFARRAVGQPTLDLMPASSDASFRSYWRTTGCAPSRIVMDAPPDKEDLGPFLDVAARLRRARIPAPEVLARDQTQGFLLLTDLGQRLLRTELNSATVDQCYREAMEVLLRMQLATETAGLPPYDEARLRAELDLMPTWFLQRHLGLTLNQADWDLIERTFRALVEAALAQPRCFVHRDFHSRNLMVLDDGRLAVIDFQDAVVGPVTYDLVSLLRDCYVAWPRDQVEGWAEDYRQRARAAGLPMPEREPFLRAFDLMGLQRHIKVLGIFCRLWYRDGKPGYLADLPRVFAYVREVGQRHIETRPLVEQLGRWVGDRDLCRPREHHG